MSLTISEETIANIADYATIPIAFEVHEVYEVRKAENGGNAEFVLHSRPVANAPWIKDYDSIENGSPFDWARRFNVLNWGFFAARRHGQRVGGAVVAYNTPEIDVLAGRADAALLWDLRVAPTDRREGIGAALVQAAEAWATGRGCPLIIAETQNINVPACKFYAQQGFVLEAARWHAYPELPDDIQLLWGKRLD